MQHLLAGDIEDHPAPALDGFKLIAPKTRTRRALEAERRVEVLTHQGVLKLSSLAEQVGQFLAVPHDDRRFSPHRRKLSPAMTALNGENLAELLGGGRGETAGDAGSQSPPAA